MVSTPRCPRAHPLSGICGGRTSPNLMLFMINIFLPIDLYRLIGNKPSIFYSGTARFFETSARLGRAGARIPHPRPFAVAAAAAIFVPASVALWLAAGYHPV